MRFNEVNVILNLDFLKCCDLIILISFFCIRCLLWNVIFFGIYLLINLSFILVYLGDDNVVVNKGSLSKIMKIVKIIGFVLVWVILMYEVW